MTDLLQCPFCGRTATQGIAQAGPSRHLWSFAVVCWCDAFGPTAFSDSRKRDAVRRAKAAWNRRKP